MLLVDYPDSASDDDSESSVEREYGTIDRDDTSGGISHPNSSVQSLTRKRKIDDTLGDNNTQFKLPPPPPPPPPPLPPSFHSLYATNVRISTSDDPALHGGRKRQIPHVQGNWPSHIYLEWFPDGTELEHLNHVIREAQPLLHPDAKINTFVRSPLGVQLPLHISLSAPLVLTTAVKDDFRQRLRTSLDVSDVSGFQIKFKSLDLVSNVEGTRHFLILRSISPPGGELRQLLDVCNTTCRGFGLPTLYEGERDVGVRVLTTKTGKDHQQEAYVGSDDSDTFHVSIAWTLHKPSSDVREAMRKLALGALSNDTMVFDEVKLKIGSTIEGIELQKQ